MSSTNGEIEQVFSQLNSKLRRFKEAFGVETLERARQRTPVVTGAMKGGWGFTMKATEIEFYNVCDHAYYVEYGTVHQAPRAVRASEIAFR